MVKIWITVPCYNEADRLKSEEFLEFTTDNQDIGFVFVNDGSLDQTAKVLEELHAGKPDQIEYINLEKNSGKAEAVRTGLLHALEKKPTYIGYWDADLATPLCEIRTLHEIIDNNQELKLIMGIRLASLGRKIIRSPKRHYLGRIIATLIAGLIIEEQVYDTQCGAKIFRVDNYTEQLFKEPFCSRWLFDVEILLRLQRRQPLRGTVFEQPLNKWIDVDGSKIKISHAPAIILNLFKLWRLKRKIS